MSQIVTINAIPYRANLVACQTGSLKDEVLDSGEYLAICSTNNLDSNGQGILDSYIVGDGVTTVSQLVSTSLHSLGGDSDSSIDVETKNAASALSINADKLTVINGAVGTSTITLQVPNDNKAHVWDIMMTTDSSVSITFATSNGATILKPSGFSVAASKDVEISVIGVGNKYYLRYGEFTSE